MSTDITEEERTKRGERLAELFLLDESMIPQNGQLVKCTPRRWLTKWGFKTAPMLYNSAEQIVRSGVPEM